VVARDTTLWFIANTLIHDWSSLYRRGFLPQGFLEAQSLRDFEMSVVISKAARIFFDGRQHTRPLVGPDDNASTKLTYPVPETLVKQLAGFGFSPQPQEKHLPSGKTP